MNETRALRSSGHSEYFTLIGHDLSLGCGIGTIGPVQVEGQVHGDIQAPRVEVASAACISGTIEADHAVIDGHVAGGVYGGVVSLGSAARVGGDIVCRRLYSAPGAEVAGRTSPSMRLNLSLLRGLARIARDARAAEALDPGVLAALFREGLVFRHRGAAFVSIFGHLELGRRWLPRSGRTAVLLGKLKDRHMRAANATTARRAPHNDAELVSVIADDLTLVSDLKTRGDVRIHGDVYGRIQCRSCMIGDASRIAGAISARAASVRGHVSGPLTASSVLLHTTARIDGEVTFDSIEVQGGAQYSTARQTLPSAAPCADNRLAA